MAEIEVSLDGGVALIDAADVPLVEGRLWTRRKNNVVSSPRRHQPSEALHRLVMGCDRGDGIRIDHIDGDILNNRRSNLRRVGARENGWHRVKRNKNNTSGIPGVSRNRSNWMAYIDRDGTRTHLGTYPSIEEAADVRRAAELEFFGEYAPHDVSIHKSPKRGDSGGDAPIV